MNEMQRGTAQAQECFINRREEERVKEAVE